MKDAKVNYSEGDIIDIPLRDESGRKAIGVVARMDGKGSVLGYFFPPESDLEKLEPDKAILIGKFGDLGLIEKSWSVVGKVNNWNRDEWPLPPLMRVDEEAGLLFLSHYDDKTMKFMKEVQYDLDSNSELKMYPRDSLMGAGAAEIRLTKLINS